MNEKEKVKKDYKNRDNCPYSNERNLLDFVNCEECPIRQLCRVDKMIDTITVDEALAYAQRSAYFMRSIWIYRTSKD